MRRALTAAALCGAAGVVALAQQSQQPPSFRSGVDVVQVDVSVLDKKRVPVEGLTAADFTVLEDGKPRRIVAFAPVTLPAPPAAAPAPAWTREVAPDVASNDVPREGRLVIIMFDWSIRFTDAPLARRIAAAAVDQLGPGDLAAVVFTSAFGNAGAPQDFTADRARLLAAINQPFALALHNPPVGPGHDPRNANYVMLDDPEGYESGDCHCRVCVAEAISRVADVVRNVPERRKTLLFIGTYFRSYEGLQGPVSRPPAGPPASITGIVTRTPQQMNCSAYLKDARDHMQRAASLANLTIHTLDPVGLETGGNSPMGGSAVGMQERQGDLRVLADLAGGRTIMNTGAPEEKMPDLFAESRSYYLLAFEPGDTQPNGKLHSIAIKVRRPGVTVRTRSGYYAGETRAKNRAALVSPEAEALGGVLPRNDLPLVMTAAPFAGPSDAAAVVAVVLGVQQPASDTGAAVNAPAKFVMAAFDRQGRAVASETQTIAVTRRSTATGAIPYEVLSRLSLKPGRYELRGAVDAGPNAKGSVFGFVDVPDFARDQPALSGVVLAASPQGLAEPRDAFVDLLPVIPTTRRAFAHADRVTAFVRVHQGAARASQPVTVTLTIRNVKDQVAVTDARAIPAAAFGNLRSADYRFDLPVERLPAGEYLLAIEAAEGSLAVRRTVRFAVND